MICHIGVGDVWELIKCGYAYSLIYNMMMCHVGIGGVKLEF